MTAIRGAGGLVVVPRPAFASDYSDLDATVPLLQLVKEAGCLKEGSEGSAIVPEVAVLDEDIVVTHKLPGPFSRSLLNEVLVPRHYKCRCVRRSYECLSGGRSTSGCRPGFRDLRPVRCRLRSGRNSPPSIRFVFDHVRPGHNASGVQSLIVDRR